MYEISYNKILNHILSKVNLFGMYTNYEYPNLREVIKSDEGTNIFDDIVFNNFLTKKLLGENISIRNINDQILLIMKNHYSRIYGKKNIEFVSIIDTEISCFIKTPKQLVNEMLDQLPKEVWSNPNLTWFDPCCGCGTFIIEIYKRLINHLPEPYNNKKYIFSNMLYFNDINNAMIYRLKLYFDLNKDIKYNIYSEDFINMNINKKFDIIVGNPPFKKTKLFKTGNIKSKYIEHQFISKSISLLNNKGYCCMILPSGFLTYVEGKNFRNFIKPYLKKIVNYNNTGKNKIFNIGLYNFCYIFCSDNNNNYEFDLEFIQNNKKYSTKIDIKKYNDIIPLYRGPISKSIFEKVINKTEKNITIIESNKQKKIDENDFINKKVIKIPIMFSIKNKNKNFGYAKSENAMKNYNFVYFENPKNSEKYLKWINTDIFMMMISCLMPNYKIQPSFLKYIGMINIEFNNDDDLYKYFEFNDEEINFIKNIDKLYYNDE